MGQTLSEPVVEKHTSAGEDDTLVYAVSEMQGWRISMEDAHATILNLDGKTGKDKVSFFAVYDGHGGSTAARIAGDTVHNRLAALDEYKQNEWRQALKRAFLKTDEDLRADPKFANDPSGCTAVTALIVPDDKGQGIYVANAGDSRCVLGVNGRAEAMSDDHKPGNDGERARIMQAGGFVEYGRVNGNLALSRAIGDFEFKQNANLEPERQIVTADPDIAFHKLEGEEEFLVLACDGIWDCLSNQQVVDFVRRAIAERKELQTICEEMMDVCLAPDSEIGGIGCDNMTVCVIALLGGRTKEAWYKWVKERVDNRSGWDTPDRIAPVFQSQGGRGRGPQDMNPLGGGVLSVLAGGRGRGRGDDDDDNDEHGGFGRNPQDLAQALSQHGIVFRAANRRDEEGNPVYEAHVAEDDSSDDDDAMESVDHAKIEELQQDGKAEEGRPTLEHQPEIVESPRAADGNAKASGAQTETEAGTLSLTDKSEDPLKTLTNA